MARAAAGYQSARGAVAGGVALLVAVVVADLAVGRNVSLAGLLVLGPLIAASRARPPVVGGLAAAAFLLGVPLGASNHVFFELRHFVSLGLIAAGGIIGVTLARALTDLRTLRDAERAALDRIALLERSTRLVAAPLDVATRLEALAQLPVPDIGELCVIDLLDRDGRPGRVILGAADPERAEAIRTMRTRFPVDLAGEHPVAIVMREGTPLLIASLDDNAFDAFATDPEYLAMLRWVRYRSAVVVPLVARGRTLGTLSLLRFGDASPFDANDLSLVSDLAARSAISIDNAQLFDELRDARAQLEAILSVIAEGLTVLNLDGRIVYANAAARQLLRDEDEPDDPEQAVQSFLERYEMFDESGRALDLGDTPARAALRGEEPAATLIRLVHRETGEERWNLLKASAVHDDDGAPTLAVSLIEDVTEDRLAAERTTLLAEASKALARTAESADGLEQLATTLAPRLASSCVVLLTDERGRMRRIAARPDDAEAPPEAVDVLASGRPVLRSDGSAIVVPLVAGEEAIGVLSLVRNGRRRAFGPADLELAEELGRRGGLAVAHARVHQQRTHVAATLQRSLLPPSLPDVPRLSIAARFRAAGSGNEVGGDFYDIFEVEDAWVVLIGDVTGKGPDAAAITALARYTMRTAARYEASPSEILRRLNEALLLEAGERRRLCTAVCVRIAKPQDDEPVRATLACGGHPLPLRITAAGDVAPICRPGPLLGAFEDADWDAESIELAEGDRLLLYTDGVTDTTGADERFGELRLHATLRGLGPVTVERLAESLDEALLAFEEGPQRDDVALLVLAAESSADITPDATVIESGPA